MFEFIRKMARLHSELRPLQRGELINLHVSGQQYAYARRTKTEVVVIAINNESKEVGFQFEIDQTGLVDGTTLVDRLGSLSEVRVSDRKVKVTLPGRSAVVFVPR